MAIKDDELTAAAAHLFSHFDCREAASQRTRQLWEWALSLISWDGILPIAVLATPNLMRLLLPNLNPVLAFMAVFGPVIALSIRFVIGWGRMRSGRAYVWQLIVFTVAISSLFLCEAFILNDQFGGGPKIADPPALLVMFLVYLIMMAIALFPFCSLVTKIE
jgi:hypothetical protein